MERESFLVPDYRRGKVESVVGAWRLRAGPGAREAATHFSHGRDSASHIRCRNGWSRPLPSGALVLRRGGPENTQDRDL